MRCLLLAALAALPAALAAQAPARHVWMIGVDGLSGPLLERAPAPHLRALMARGSYTFTARAVIPTVSSPNWASIISAAGPSQHGVTSNEWQRDKREILPVCSGSDGIFPTLFGLLRAQRPRARSVVIHDWKDFGRLLERGSATHLAHHKGSPQATAEAIRLWREAPPELLFLHLDDVDHAGHDHGWGSPAYFEAIAQLDKLVGEVLAAIEQAGRTAQTLVVLTADHGGQGTKHGGMAMDDLLVPFIVAGPGVAANRRIETPVNNWDAAATAAKALGLTPHPCWLGRPVTR